MVNFLKSFVYAFHGFATFFRHERNGKIQLFVAAVAISLSCWLGLSSTEWLAILGCIGAVLSLEMINSAIEKLCNLVHPAHHPLVKSIKDMCAGAVLWVSITSTIIGVIIFLPKILLLL